MDEHSAILGFAWHITWWHDNRRSLTALLYCNVIRKPLAGQGFGIVGVKLKTVSLVVLPNEARKALIHGAAKRRPYPSFTCTWIKLGPRVSAFQGHSED